jgi:hypothetical protein
MALSPTVAGRSSVPGLSRTSPLAGFQPFVVSLFVLSLAIGVLLSSQAHGGSAQQETHDQDEVEFVPRRDALPANRDSLLREIERYSGEITAIKDSLGYGKLDLQLDARQRERLQTSVSEFSGIIEDIGQELSRLDFEITDNRVSLIDEFGEGIIITIPENLDERLSEGMQALSQMILEDLPDSNVFGLGGRLDIASLFSDPRPQERKIIQGNVIKVSDDVHITAVEDLRGSLVVVMGDAVVSGRVDGDVVVVLGNLLLAENSEVTGKVICVMGQLDRDPSAEVGDLVAIDPWPSGNLFDSDFWSEGFTTFLVSQSLFLVALMVAILMVVITPKDRMNRILVSVRTEPLQSLGIGVLAGVGLHVVTGILLAVLILTVVGLPLALLLGIGLGMVAALAVALAGAAVGERLCKFLGRECSSLWVSVVVGLVALHAVSFLGGLTGILTNAGALSTMLLILGLGIKSLAFFLGIGALARSQAWSKNPS